MSTLGKESPLLPAGEERASAPQGSPASCTPSNSQHKSACAQLTPCRTGSGPHSILRSRAALRQLGSVARTAPKSTHHGGEGHP